MGILLVGISSRCASPRFSGWAKGLFSWSKLQHRSAPVQRSKLHNTVRLQCKLSHHKPVIFKLLVTFLQVDISEDELKLRKPAVGLLGDATAVVKQINAAIKDKPFSLGKGHPWIAKLLEKTEANAKKMAAALAKNVVPMNFQCSLRVVRDELAKVRPDFQKLN